PMPPYCKKRGRRFQLFFRIFRQSLGSAYAKSGPSRIRTSTRFAKREPTPRTKRDKRPGSRWIAAWANWNQAVVLPAASWRRVATAGIFVIPSTRPTTTLCKSWTDLGSSFKYKGKLYFLFGDAAAAGLEHPSQGLFPGATIRSRIE